MSKRILAHFQPQAWINDYAVDIDGACDVDVTDQIVAMGREEALKLKDCSHETDVLWYNSSEGRATDHSGPFAFYVEDAIHKFYGEN
jgi:hypothetical protein